MIYVIVGEDVANSLEKRQQARGAHVARLQKLQDNGQLILAGPFPNVDATDPGLAGFSGSLIVAEFASLEAAQVWANSDPYLLTGVYAKVSIKPFKKVFPA